MSIKAYFKKKKNIKEEDFRFAEPSPHILIATPSVMEGYTEDEISLVTQNLKFLVIDEVDFLVSETSGEWFLKFIKEFNNGRRGNSEILNQ